jgi:nicotinamide-nucleotide amidase
MSELKKLASRLGEILQQRGWMAATAESCTGGWIAKCITDIDGSSVWFDRGFVSYSNASKQEMLGVDAAILEAEGAVSEATVVAMVRGTLKHCRADIAVAVSGIAGPGGGSQDKPVGTVCFAWATRDGLLRAATVHFEGDRETVRRRAVIHALEGLLDAGNA